MYDHPRHPLPARTDLRRPGVDPGGVHPGGAGKSSGLGHVRLRLLLRHDLHLDAGVRLRGSSQQRQLGRSRLCVSWHRRLLLPQRLSGFGQSDSGDEGQDKPTELSAGHLCSGFLVRGDFALLHPHHPVGHAVEILLEVSSLQSRTRTEKILIGGEGFRFPLCSERRPRSNIWVVPLCAGERQSRPALTVCVQIHFSSSDNRLLSTDAVNTDVDEMM